MGDPFFTQEVLMCFEVSQRPSAFVTFELQQQERIREARRRQHRARFRGIVRSTVQLRRAARRASERTFSPGEAGYLRAADEFRALHAQLLCQTVRAMVTRRIG